MIESNEKKILPKNWHWEKLKDITRIVSGTTPKSGVSEYWNNGEIVWITPTDLGGNSEKNIVTSTRLITKTGFESCGLEIVPPGSIVLSSRAPIGYLGIARIPLCTNQGCKSFVPSDQIDSLFLYYALKQSVATLQKLGSGATFAEVSKTQLENFEIPLPPIEEQKRIATRLDEQMHYFEQARQTAEESLSAAWDLPSSYLSSVFDDSDGRHWKWEKLNDVCELLPAKAIKTIGNTSVIAITSACLTENGFSPDGLKSARMDENDAKVALVKKDEILIARSNTPELVGRVSIYPGDPPNVVASDLTIRIWAKPSCYPPFLNAYLSYLYLSGYWKERAGGASGTMKKITRSQLLDIKVPVPDIDTQKKIVEEMQEKMNHFKQLEHSLESQLAEINELPSALLRQAFAGQL